MSSDIKAPYCCCSVLLDVIFDAIISKNFDGHLITVIRSSFLFLNYYA